MKSSRLFIRATSQALGNQTTYLLPNKILYRNLALYSKAIVRDIDISLTKDALRKDTSVVIDFELAKEQHDLLCEALKKTGVTTQNLSSDALADSVFIEDTMVAIGKTILVTNPGAPSRSGESKRVIEHLVSQKTHFILMKTPGCLDGGDVLFTGKEIFVGHSERTNAAGIAQLAQAFPELTVTAIDICELSSSSNNSLLSLRPHAGETSDDSLTATLPLHLKSICSVGGPDHLLLGGPFAARLKHLITSVSKFPYTITLLPDEGAANCVWVNGTLIRRSDLEFPASKDILASLGGKQIQIHYTELAKVDGALTCCSVLLE